MNKEKFIFRFENVSLGYPLGNEKLELIKNFSSEFRTGELIAVVGRNGTGKSTLLKSMLGLVPLLSGKILLNNTILQKIHPGELPLLISFVSTEIPRNPVMTVYELVSLGRFPFTNWIGTLKKHDHEEIMLAIENAGLTHLMQKPLYKISDGERQRAMIARTLAQNTPIIVLDEPTAFLDLPNKYELISLLAELSSKGRTVIFTTHDTGIALRFPDKLLILDNKEIIEGAPEDLILNGRLGSLFQSPEFKFSITSGDIEIIRKTRKLVSLDCPDSIQREWTQRALTRAGYGIGGKKESLISITGIVDNKKTSWKVDYHQSDHYFYSIYDLIYFLTTELI
jgi:iron complex transport system ATP-binding protein